MSLLTFLLTVAEKEAELVLSEDSEFRFHSGVLLLNV
jgi:tRNA isopentenyl-2-thiomethyl-A-37 hydroxylase MiaE